jgi:hypothetical protein
MPIAKVQLPDGRIGRFEVPEGTTPEQVLQFAKGMGGSETPSAPVTGMNAQPGPEMMPSHTSAQSPGLLPSHNQDPMARAAEHAKLGIDTEPAAGTFAAAPKFDMSGFTPAPKSVAEEHMGYPVGLFDTKAMMENAPADAKAFAGDLANMVTHLPQVYQGVKYIAKSGIDSVMAGEADPVMKQLGQAIMDEYGSYEAFKKTYEDKPFRTTLDVAGGLGLIGTVMKGAGAATKVNTLSKAGRAATSAADNLDLVGQVAKMPSRLIPKEAPRHLMESAVKASTVTDRTKRNKFIDTMIKHGVIPDEGGLAKVWNKIEDFGAQVDSMIDNADRAGNFVRKEALFKNINTLLDEAKFSDAPLTNKKIVNRVMDEFDGAHGELLKPSEVQKIKQSIYRAVNYDRKAGKAKPMFNEMAKKDVARAAKEELETIFPELKNINAAEGELLSIVEPLTKAVNRISNRDVVGMGMAIKGGMGGYLGNLLGGGPGQTAGFILGLISSSPKTQARFSLLLDRAKKLENVNTRGAGALLLQGERAQQTQENQ